MKLTKTKPILSITLPIELTNGNTGRGSRWFSSANTRKQIEAKLRAIGLTREPYDFPVRINVTRIIGSGQRLWDSSSIGRGNYKEIEDALVVCGWFHDDSPKWITETRFYQDSTRRATGKVTDIEIYRAD